MGKDLIVSYGIWIKTDKKLGETMENFKEALVSIPLLIFIIIIITCSKVNRGELFYDEGIYNPKVIKKLSICDGLEEKLSDTLNIDMYHVKYYQVDENKYAIYFTDTKNHYDKDRMQYIGTSYLVILNDKCEIMKIKSEFHGR